MNWRYVYKGLSQCRKMLRGKMRNKRDHSKRKIKVTVRRRDGKREIKT